MLSANVSSVCKANDKLHYLDENSSATNIYKGFEVSYIIHNHTGNGQDDKDDVQVVSKLVCTHNFLHFINLCGKDKHLFFTFAKKTAMLIQNNNKKVVAVHDLSCIGRVSLNAVIPILTSMGLEVTPLPTALLSNHTQYPSFTFLDLTNEMRKIIANWKEQGFRFNAFYTGYLGSPEQVQVVSELIHDFRRPTDLTVVDPVLGDNGHLYKGMNPDMVNQMRDLIKLADVITPNMTEMFLLLDKPYRHENLSDEELKAYLRALSDQGPSIVIVTSVPVIDNPHLTSVYAYNRNGNRYWKVTCPFLPAHYPGTGDAFTSVITGSLMQGDSLPLALDRAMQFTLQGIRSTFGYDYSNLEGIMLEKVLSNLSTPIQVSSYELI
jgi:pyridoxine kinase